VIEEKIYLIIIFFDMLMEAWARGRTILA
jgi:hypothetical protein